MRHHKLLLLLFILNFIFCLKYSKNTRRLIGGRTTRSEHGFVVYFLKSEKSTENRYDEWLCGGAIVSSSHILTAAACLLDVSHLYVIAGYEKYVRPEYLDSDPCTKNRKQRVVKTCVPKAYNFSTTAYDWVAMDIGLATVEKPYNFTDLTYRMDCTYEPRPIKINYHVNFPEKNMLIFGWGHTRGLRLPGDTVDYNSLYLQVTTTTQLSKSVCKNYFKKTDKIFNDIVQNYMVCTRGSGMLDSEGESNEEGKADIKYYKGCEEGIYARRGMTSEKCPNIEDNTASNSFEKIILSNGTDVKESNKTLGRTTTGPTRRGNICVNDHGSPLVGWRGSELMVMGVAVTSSLDEYNHCVDPSLFTNTRCMSRFIACAMQEMSTRVSRKMCQNVAEEEGYEIHETDVDWSTSNDDLYMDSYDVDDAEIKSRRSRIMKKPYSNYTIGSELATKTNST